MIEVRNLYKDWKEFSLKNINYPYLFRFLKFFFFDKMVVCEIVSVQNEK